MVDRIGNGPGYGYPQVNEKKVNTNAAGTGEKFRLDYGKEGAIYEPSSEALKKQQAEKNVVSKTDNATKAEENGVRLSLSDAAERSRVKENETSSGIGIFDTVTRAVNKALNAIKEFFAGIWNDEPATGENTVQKNETEVTKTEKPKTRFEEAKAEAEAFLASTEGKKAARNSDLLTYYDKHGTVVSVSPSDRQRILYGDKNQIEV